MKVSANYKRKEQNQVDGESLKGNIEVSKKKGERTNEDFLTFLQIVTEEDRLQSFSPFTIGGCISFFLLFPINSQPKQCDRKSNPLKK